MDPKQQKPTPATKPKMGRPPMSDAKKSIEVTVEGDFVVIKVPRKDLTKKLLAELI